MSKGKKGSTPTCSFIDCQNVARSNNLCRKHYQKKVYEKKIYRESTGVFAKGCAVENCARIHWAKGYCNLHYRRMHRHGDPGFVTPKKHYKVKRNDHFLVDLRDKQKKDNDIPHEFNEVLKINLIN